MNSEAIQKYTVLMTEIKRRKKVAYGFMSGNGRTGFKATSIEVVYLQFRKILELIAFGSLVANKEIFSEVHSKFSQYWNAEKLMNDMERVNPYFYPQPVIPRQSDHLDIKIEMESVERPREWMERPNNYLTKEDLIKLYKKCGAIMHSGNPYGSQIDYQYYQTNMEYWASRITNLLTTHYIRLVNDPCLYFIQLGSDEEVPRYYVATPLSSQSTEHVKIDQN